MERIAVIDVYIIRHANAVERDTGGYTDEQRPLTDEGHSQAQRLAQALLARNLAVDCVLTSPFVRAMQTAQHLASAWTPQREPTVCEHLAPGGKRRKLSRFIRGLVGKSAAIVGHEPDLSLYTAWLIGSKKAHLELAKAGMAYVQCEADLGKGSGVLVWMLTPQWLIGPGQSVDRSIAVG